MFLWGQGKRIEGLVQRHLSLVVSTLKAFEEALTAYLNQAPEAQALARKVHEHESRADDVRREVIQELLQGALMGTYRADVLRLVERLDRLANTADTLARTILLQSIRIPAPLKPQLLAIADKTMLLLQQLESAIRMMFEKMAEVMQHTHRVEKLEGEIDRIEQEAIRQLFAMDLDLAQKLWVRDFITQLAQVSDLGEDLSDLIEIIVARRHA
ncbi:MAG TPA: DUF47 family protein [Candidatus Bipolaricaulota bacterium]